MKKALTNEKKWYIMKSTEGVMAQLVERLVRNEEASGSNPLSSTKKYGWHLPSVFFGYANRENR